MFFVVTLYTYNCRKDLAAMRMNVRSAPVCVRVCVWYAGALARVCWDKLCAVCRTQHSCIRSHVVNTQRVEREHKIISNYV